MPKKKDFKTYVLSYIYDVWRGCDKRERLPDNEMGDEFVNSLLTTGNYELDCARGVYTYLPYPDKINRISSLAAYNRAREKYRIPLSQVDRTKYRLVYTGDSYCGEKLKKKSRNGSWLVKEYPDDNKIHYEIVKIHDKEFVLGKRIKIKERDDFKFVYYEAAEPKYDMFFGDLLQPEFGEWVIAECNTKCGIMRRYGKKCAEARAFLRGAIMDYFGSIIAQYVLADEIQKKK